MIEVEVVIPFRNNVQFLPLTLQSVFAQTYPIKRVILIDDASEESWEHVLAPFREAGHKIDVFKNAHRLGPSASRNVGIRELATSHVAFIDADDLWHPQKIQIQVDKILESGDMNTVVYNGFVQITEDGFIFPLVAKSFLPSLKGDVRTQLLYANLICGSNSAVLASTAAVRAAGAYDETLAYAEDWDLWLSLAKSCPYAYSENILTYVRRHNYNSQKNYPFVLEHFSRFVEKRVREEKEIPNAARISWAITFVDLLQSGRLEGFSDDLLRSKISKSAANFLFKETRGSFLAWESLLTFKREVINEFRKAYVGFKQFVVGCGRGFYFAIPSLWTLVVRLLTRSR